MTTDLEIYRDVNSEDVLAKHAIDIHRHHNETVKFMARKQIEVGRLLLHARAEFKGDKEFGQWRQECTPIGSRQTATKLMALARGHETGRITDKILDNLPTSTIFELLAAPESVIAAVEEKIDKGETPSQKEVRKEVKGEEPKSEVEVANDKAAKGKENQVARDQDNTTFDDAQYNDVLQKTLPIRIAFARKNSVPRMTDELAWVVFGIPPFAEGIPNEDVVNAVYNMYTTGKEFELKPDQEAILTKAYNRLMNFYGE
ncbi:hypothetical protein JKY79_01040 [Candidatus Babeliales bacterium]|nr:hypothetical protein [Candidatus Babeliales bacterium]